MGFEEFFENNRKDYRNNRGHNYHDDNEYSNNPGSPQNEFREKPAWQGLLEKIRSDKKLRIIAVTAGILFLTIVVVLIIVLFPQLIKLINYIAQNGLQGVINTITGFLDKILNGTSK
jgi:hypothetical protein